MDPIVERWRKEKINEHYEYLISDALYFHVRENGQVSKRPFLITIGVDSEGYRDILGINMAYSEDEISWRTHVEGLRERGLRSVSLTISDDNKGLVNTLKEEFSATSHQRCMVHFERNILSKVPAKDRKKLSKYLKHIYNAPDREMALEIAEIISKRYRDKYPSVSDILDKHLEETLTFYNYCDKHYRKIRTTNLLEGLNRIIKRRSKVIGVFPNAESCIRYVSCVLMEIGED